MTVLGTDEPMDARTRPETTDDSDDEVMSIMANLSEKALCRKRLWGVVEWPVGGQGK